MMTLFMNLNKKEGKTVLLVTHDMEHVMNYCDHVIVLSHGEVTQEADVKEFLSILNIYKRLVSIHLVLCV